MCGILGIVRRDGVLPDPAWRSSALAQLERRGPDGVGEWSEGGTWFGHRRLAVLDPSTAAAQPMHSFDGRYTIVFNGEIYNHLDLRRDLNLRWRSTSDTETLLECYRRWGSGCVQRLQGMFAFGIWDHAERELFLARDRLGVKPLYYAGGRAFLAFGSRPGALARLQGSTRYDIDAEAARAYFELGYVPAPLSMHAGIRKLPAGHTLTWRDGAKLRRYWDYAQIAPDPELARRSEADLAADLGQQVQAAVQSRLISDVPLGAFLSAGVDSSLVVAAMKASGVERPRTFTIGFRDSRYDESAEAERISHLLGTEHHVEMLEVDDLLELLPVYVERFDEPLADTSIFPTLAVSRLARRHVTVALSGDGGDELFGGYHYYDIAQRLAPLWRLRPGLRASLRRVVRRLPGHRAALLAGALGQRDAVAVHHFMRGVGKDFETVLRADVLAATTPLVERFEQAAASFALDLEPAETGMRLDLRFMLADCYLQKVDLASMAYSLEVRCPLTDYRLVEWAMRLPLRYKLQPGRSKHLLRLALAHHLPEAITNRPKSGFGTPMAAWLRGPLRDWAADLLDDRASLDSTPLDAAALHRLFAVHQSGARDAHPLLWGALMLLAQVRRAREAARPASTLPAAA